MKQQTKKATPVLCVRLRGLRCFRASLSLVLGFIVLPQRSLRCESYIIHGIMVWLLASDKERESVTRELNPRKMLFPLF
jgi:hypothetical protein